jgi:hypothetical protein
MVSQDSGSYRTFSGQNVTNMKITVIVILLLLIFAGRGFAAEPAVIVLRDGSVIHAEITSIHDGLYTLKSESLGTINIQQSLIASIKIEPGGPAGNHGSTPMTPNPAPQKAEPNVTTQIKALREAMMGDKAVMDKISALSNDPDVMRAVQDPEIMKDVVSGDIAALLSNSKFKELLNNPKIQEIIKKVSP